MLFTAIILLYGFQIIIFFLLKRSWFEAKLSAETLASILNNIFSTSYNVSALITIQPKKMEINIFSNSVSVHIDNSQYVSKLFKPNYINLKESSIKCSENSACKILIIKINDEILFVK